MKLAWNDGEASALLSARRSVVVLGTFDGVHRGHALLIRRAMEIAVAGGLPCVVYTFSNPPWQVLRPGAGKGLLTTREEKAGAIGELGPELLVMRPFTPEFAALSPGDFVAHLWGTLRPAHLVAGENYSFGQRGAGDADALQRLLAPLEAEAHIVPPLLYGAAPISSTRIREAILAGEIPLARQMLGRPYELGGTVSPGKRVGRRLGYPTANLPFPEGKTIPRFGVYVARVLVAGEVHQAVLNIGKHPTLPEGPPTIEVFLLDAEAELYGLPMRVLLLDFLRPEQRFADAEELRAQIGRDVERARGFFAREAVLGGE